MIAAIISGSAPLLFAALGGLFSQQAGKLNISLEGSILIGSFGTIGGLLLTGDPFLGAVIGVTGSFLLSVLLYLFGPGLEGNIYVAGLAINLLAGGITASLSSLLFGTKGIIRLGERYAGLHPKLQHGYTFFICAAYLAAGIITVILKMTPFGIRLRAAGSAEEILRLRGGTPAVYQFWGITLSGIFSGLAGAALAFDLGSFVPGMSAGRGWIALALIFLGDKKPWGIAVGAVLFSSAVQGAIWAQGAANLPKSLLLALPYFLTVAAFVLVSGIKRYKMKNHEC